MIKLKNYKNIPEQYYDEILTAKYMLTYNNDNNDNNNNITNKEKDTDKDNIYTFDSIDKFEISLPSKLNKQQLSSYNILVKPKDKSPKEKFKFTIIKRLSLYQYKFNHKISISHHFKIEKWNPYNPETSGILQLFCKQTIVINSNAIIDANGCGYDYRVK